MIRAFDKDLRELKIGRKPKIRRGEKREKGGGEDCYGRLRATFEMIKVHG